MLARDVMANTVVTVRPETDIREAARLLLENRISAVPVVDGMGKAIGIVSEGDLMRRPETGAARHSAWWLSILLGPEDQARAYVRTHGRRVGDIMTRDVVTVEEDASLEYIAETLERHRIKRVPVVWDGKVVGIVSRADLLHGLVARQAAAPSEDDRAIRAAVEAALSEAGVRREFLSVVVAGGVVHLWGAAQSDAEKQAIRIAVEGAPGVAEIRDEVGVLPLKVRAMMWTE